MRLIDADALEPDADYDDGNYWAVSMGQIQFAPTIDPVRKGKWVRALDGIDGHVRCDQCFKIYDWDMQAQYYTFCPNCCAKMEEGEQE